MGGTISASQATSCRTRLATLPSKARCTRPPPGVPMTSRSGRYSSIARRMAAPRTVCDGHCVALGAGAHRLEQIPAPTLPPGASSLPDIRGRCRNPWPHRPTSRYGGSCACTTRASAAGMSVSDSAALTAETAALDRSSASRIRRYGPGAGLRTTSSGQALAASAFLSNRPFQHISQGTLAMRTQNREVRPGVPERLQEQARRVAGSHGDLRGPARRPRCPAERLHLTQRAPQRLFQDALGPAGLNDVQQRQVRIQVVSQRACARHRGITLGQQIGRTRLFSSSPPGSRATLPRSGEGAGRDRSERVTPRLEG